jgi:hypothetical protein
MIFKKKKSKTESVDIEAIFDDLCNLRFDEKTCFHRGIVDINEHLPTLRKYASLCDHVTELGTRFAISTHAFLIACPKKFVSIDLNYHFFQPFEKDVRNFASHCATDFEFIVGDVLEMEIEETDLLFIDTLHTYNQLSLELRAHESRVKRWIILHDTETYGERDEVFYEDAKISDKVKNINVSKSGLRLAVSDFLRDFKEWQIKEHFSNNNGLTVLERA